MQVHFGTDLLSPEWSTSVVCIGTFDGVHLGHAEVIRTAVQEAQRRECPSIVVTFDRHPAHLLAPNRVPAAIATLEQNLTEFERLGVAVTVILPFDEQVASMEPEDFMRLVLVDLLKCEFLVVGHDFAMGKGRRGTTDWLKNHIATLVVPPLEQKGVRVSSSNIRNLISEGKVERASLALGRPFAISGVVVSGQKLGRTLGFPTLNLARSFNQVMPLDGVYAGFCRTPFGVYKSAISIGMRPTVEGQHRTIEAYLIQYPGDSLYGASVLLSLVAYLRGEEKFGSLDDLKTQMIKDTEIAASFSVPT